MDCSTPGFPVLTISQSLIKLMSIESMMPSNHLAFYHPLLLLPSIFPSIRVFSNESAFCIRWPKYWSFSLSNEYSGLISFRIDWFDLLAIQGTLIAHIVNSAFGSDGRGDSPSAYPSLSTIFSPVLFSRDDEIITP